MLWWWCLDYAHDGDLSKQGSKIIEEACHIPIQTLMRAGFIDSRPYRRIHGWYEIQGNYLRARFKDHPEKWQRIKQLYENESPISLHRSNGEGNTTRNNPRSTTDVQYGRTDVQDVRTDVETSSREASRFAEATRSPAPEKEKECPPSTNGTSNELEIATPQEVKEIMDKWRKENPRSGKR